MEQIVQSYIYSKPCGVKLTDLEGFLKQSRLRLGYITRKLLNEGKIIKKDDKYYPVKSPDASKL